jgi:glucan phosphoethanolaminetransferase (alkaline phosphatase superfamily)
MSVSTCGILGLMALAFLPWRIDYRAALAGFVAAYASLFLMMFFLQIKPHIALANLTDKDLPAGTAGINFLLWPVITNLVCVGVALLLNAFLRREAERASDGAGAASPAASEPVRK